MNLIQARGILLANIMKADHLVRLEEVEAGRKIALREAKTASTDSDARSEAHGNWIEAMNSTELEDFAINVLRRLPLTERQTIIDDLWNMAACDAEVHAAETDLIVRYAKKLGLPPSPSRAPYHDTPHL